MKLIITLLLILGSSCASYVQNVHNQIDNEKNVNRQRAYRQNPAYRGKDNRPVQNPVTLGYAPNSQNQKRFQPKTQRNYDQPLGKRRYNANDLKDNGEDGSLWSGDNSENFLFVTNNLKRRGDIVIIEVMDAMKDKIQDELKRAFPDRRKKKTDDKAKKDEEEKKEPTQVADNKAPAKVHDKISTSVVELVNKDYLVLRGRKEVMFKKRKRFVQIQAVVSQKDIGSGDTISSEKTLEPKINILRY